MPRTKNFAEVIRNEIAADPALAAAVDAESFNAELAMKVYDLRTEAGLTQEALAELIGSRQSVISRIEDADYHGHSLDLLRRIAKALGRDLRVEFCRRRTPPFAEITERHAVAWQPQKPWHVVVRDGTGISA